LVGKQAAAEALHLPEGTLPAILAEVVNLDGRLDLALAGHGQPRPRR
jgi:hypothetical protein